MLKLLNELRSYDPYEDFEESINNGNTSRALKLLKNYSSLRSPEISKKCIFISYQKRNLQVLKYLNSILPKEIRESEIDKPDEIKCGIEIHENYFQDPL